jgi:hypothetical protein
MAVQLAESGSEELTMTRIIHGKVHGRTIELAEDLGLAEGQEVEVSIQTVPASSARKPGEGLLRTEGALADDPHWDAIMEAVHRARKLERRPPVGEP